MVEMREHPEHRSRSGLRMSSLRTEEYDTSKPDKSKRLTWLFCNESDCNKDYR